MIHNYDTVFDTDNPYWQRVLDIFAKNERYEKKVVSGRNLHHKFPRSFSRILSEQVDNDKDNLISLSLADHFLVHYYYYMLARKGFRQSMATAFCLMARKSLKYITPETAEVMAKDYAEAKKIANQFIGENNKGKHHSEESKAKISESMKGKNKNKTVTEETRRKLSEAHKGKKLAPFSDEHKRKISDSKKGKQLSDKCKAKISEFKKGKVWINDGVHSKLVDPSNQIPEGFKLGRIKMSRE